MSALVKHGDIEFSKNQIQALVDFWPVFANPKFVYETKVKAKYLYNGLKTGRR